MQLRRSRPFLWEGGIPKAVQQKYWSMAFTLPFPVRHTCCSFAVHDTPILGGDRLKDDAVDDAEEDDRGVQRTEHVLNPELIPHMSTELVEDEPGR